MITDTDKIRKSISQLETMAINLTGSYATETNKEIIKIINTKLDAIDLAQSIMSDEIKRSKGCYICRLGGIKNMEFSYKDPDFQGKCKAIRRRPNFCPDCGRKLTKYNG